MPHIHMPVICRAGYLHINPLSFSLCFGTSQQTFEGNYNTKKHFWQQLQQTGDPLTLHNSSCDEDCSFDRDTSSLGKLFRSSDLPMIVEFFLMFYKDKPVDWLLDHLLWVKVCNPEKDAKHCDRQKANLRIRYKPSLFQHIGTRSSLVGKIQNLKDKDFGKQVLHKAHNNPTAEVDTSLKVYQQYGLEKAYRGENFFWAFTPVAGDHITFRFFKPLNVKSYLFRSGNAEHPGDKVYNTTVEVLPVDKSVLLKDSIGNGDFLKNQETATRYLRIGEFVNGEAKGTIDPSIGSIEAIRLFFLAESPVWVLISEVIISKSS
nr:PREDICTED: alpha-1,3-mannosyl-glycoprotein 4-beta-N-acetylglucosaminyltransferase B-like [Latimeria chalumnae]|eukprot:XP_005996664.2 PREDICTED: alpha-1,3-mannosyl-glycoprotein 4-beta-N-acetylglucosaminyltransferase B-like [Latimeria chalumnae]